ncbi:MAG: hypothetical protein JWN94_741 [Betaproteobacteria bacterium]|nr:hypothetical protein [Betaproteobacteria bacterium]
MSVKSRKWLLISGTLLLMLIIGAVLAFQIAVRSLRAEVINALGPDSEIADLRVGLTSVVITGILIKAPRGWPADASLRAERITLMPDLRELLSRRIYVNTVTIENAYLSAVRPKQGGGVKVLPTLLEGRKKRQAQESGRTAQIATVELSNCVIELFDSTLAGHKKVRIDGVHGTLKDLTLPHLDSRTALDLSGQIKGPAHQGTIAVTGWINIAAKNSDLETRVRNVDLGLFEPYIMQKAKTGIDKGVFNLDLKASVRRNAVDASGQLTLVGLKLKSGEGPLGGFTNLPKRAVLGALADKNDSVTIHFDLNGDLDNPAFSLSEKLGLKTATALLKGLGVGFEGLVRAFFVLVSGLGSAFTPA